MLGTALLLSVLLQLTVSLPHRVSRDAQDELSTFLLRDYEPKAIQMCKTFKTAQYDYETDVENATKEEELSRQVLARAQFEKQQWDKHFRGVDWKNFKDEKLKRQLRVLSKLEEFALEESDIKELGDHTNNMRATYSSAKICPFDNQECNLEEDGISLDPDIENIMANSRDYVELVYTWKSWRDATGAKMKDNYKKYVELSNEAAQINGFDDLGDMWRDEFETEDFEEEIQKLWEQVEPLYSELHTYVRNKLEAVYGDDLGDDGLIPANVLGNMWGQNWQEIYDLVVPFPDEPLVDITPALIKQGYDAKKMFKTADNFFQSLGLPSNSMSYNESVAMIEKPKNGQTVVCHASAWDFCDKKDFRIKMCTDINTEDFIVIHHEMGHIQYFIQYKNQPYALRSGANPGFHEAVGDTIELSVSTPLHLEKIGLLTDYEDTDNASINALMQTALKKVAFLPFGLLVDKWRWDVFSGKIPQSEWNEHWWHLRESIQKVTAPVERSEEDFDPGAKFHVAADYQYISYFVAHILQFQLHKALCVAAGQYNPDDSSSKPLHKCDIFNSKEAGKLLSDGLKLGSSQHWSETLHVMTGERELDASALLEYFEPLYEFLKEENADDEEEEPQPEYRPGGILVSDDTTIPIIVGAALLILAVVGGVAYLVSRKSSTKRTSAE